MNPHAINTIPDKGTVTHLRSILKIGGKVIGWLDWDMTHSGIMEAGTFQATIPSKPDHWAWWGQQSQILVDVFAGTPPDPFNYSSEDMTWLMRARVDSLDLDPATGYVRLSGRDLTGLLIDNKTSEKWPNQTASQIAKAIADQFGFTPMVATTTTPVGTYYTEDHVKTAHADTYWSILTYLAQHEGFECHVQGNTLYFGHFGAKDSRNNYVIEIDTSGNYVSANAQRLKFSRALTLAQDISVTVKSYHGYLGASYSGTATATKTAKRVERHAEVQQTIQHYDYSIPGLTQAQCKLRANQILTDLSKHELNLEASLPFDNVLYPWVPIELRGTQTPYDTVYSVSEVRRRFSMDRVSMHIKARAGTATLPPVAP